MSEGASNLYPLHGWKFNPPEQQARNQFFTTMIGNRKTVGIMRFDKMAQPYLSAEPSVRLPAVSLYEIHAGTVGGVCIGYLMTSPLISIVDPMYALFHRRQFDGPSLLKDGAQGSNKYQLRGGVAVFVMEDDAAMFTCFSPSRLTEALDA